MKRAAVYGTMIVVCHAILSFVHGVAHSELHIGLSPTEMGFVLVVIGLCPVAAVVLLWTSWRSSGLVLLVVSMAGSLLFGVYHHFLVMGPDHVGEQIQGLWATMFALTAYGSLVTERSGSVLGCGFFFGSEGGSRAMRVFVAGGTGVLGRASIPALVEAGHHVRSSGRGNEKSDLVRKLGAEAVNVNLYDPESVRRAIAGSDAVLRLTTKFGPMTKLRDPRALSETMRLRTVGARLLVDAAMAERVPVYVHESVCFVYADGGNGWLSEDAPTDDGGVPVLRATIQGEQEAARFSAAGGRGIVLRFGGFYGADAPSTLETIHLARRRMMPQIGSASNYFASVYVPDAGRAVAAALDVPLGMYNVCDDEPVSFAEYLRALTKAIDAPKPFRLPAIVGRWMFGDVWKYFPRSQRASNARLKSVSDWRPTVKSVTEGWPIVAAELGLREKNPKASHAQDSVPFDKGARLILSEKHKEGGQPMLGGLRHPAPAARITHRTAATCE